MNLTDRFRRPAPLCASLQVYRCLASPAAAQSWLLFSRGTPELKRYQVAPRASAARSEMMGRPDHGRVSRRCNGSSRAGVA